MAVHAIITNELAQAVGTIARKHPDGSIQIDWHEGTPEQEWLVTVSGHGPDDVVYVVDDESGTHMPLNEDDVALVARGGSVFENLPVK